MKNKYTVEQSAETVWWYKFTEPNAKGETLIIELSKCTNGGGNNALPALWKKHGYIDRVLETYWSISTYVKDTEGSSFGRYNPQHKLSDDGKRAVINFNWMFEAKEENKLKLIDEVYRMFSSATGETATQKKHRKVREYAKKIILIYMKKFLNVGLILVTVPLQLAPYGLVTWNQLFRILKMRTEKKLYYWFSVYYINYLYDKFTRAAASRVGQY